MFTLGEKDELDKFKLHEVSSKVDELDVSSNVIF